jgi:hypothetical protein
MALAWDNNKQVVQLQAAHTTQEVYCTLKAISLAGTPKNNGQLMSPSSNL